MNSKLTNSGSPHINIFNREAVSKTAEDACFEYEPERYKERLRSLLKKGAKRPLIQVEDQHIQAIEKLSDILPHFKEAIELITDHLIFCRMSKHRVLELPAIALGGEPGIGKTFFAQKLAAILGCSTPQVSCGDTNGEFVFTGLDRGFSTSYPGKVAEHFLSGGEANPLFILDEFDKPRRNNSNGGSFHDCFFTLLEKSTAHQFEDQFLKVLLNASRINWLCTVNEIEKVPEPIRDRLHYIELQRPSQQDMDIVSLGIYRSLVSKIAKEKGIIFHSQDSDKLLASLKGLSPRQAKKVIEIGLAKAARRAFRENLKFQNSSGIVGLLPEDFYPDSPSALSPVTEQLLH